MCNVFRWRNASYPGGYPVGAYSPSFPVRRNVFTSPREVVTVRTWPTIRTEARAVHSVHVGPLSHIYRQRGVARAYVNMCITSVTFLVSCIAVGVDSMAIPESFPPRWLSYLRSEIYTSVYRCFSGEERRNGMPCFSLGMLFPAKDGGNGAEDGDQEVSSKEKRMLRSYLEPHHPHDAVIETEYEEEEDADKTKKKNKKKKKGSFKEGHRKKKHKTNILIPAAIGLAAIIITALVGVIGMIAGKALAMSFLAFIMTIALSTRAFVSHQRSASHDVNEDVHDVLSDMAIQLLGQTDLPVEAIVYSSRRRREI